MIVIYNNDFLEKLRRPSNIVTISSYSLGNISASGRDVEEFSKNVLKAPLTKSIDGTELLGFWDKDRHTFKLRLDLPKNFAASPQSREIIYSNTGYDLENIYQYNAIEFFDEDKTLAFVIINDTRLSILNDLIGQTRNLLNIRLPEDSVATLKTKKESSDLKFLGGYGVNLGENAFKVDHNGNIMITKESFYKVFTLKDSEMDVENISFVQNDSPYIDSLGRKSNNDYSYRIYKNLSINCPGLEHDCWIPTKYNLYRNYLDGGVKIYGTADYDEYKVFGDTHNRVASGTELIGNIPGIEFVEVKNTGLTYKINYNKQKFEYTKPDGDESSVNMNAAVFLKAVLRNYDKSEIESEQIRFYQGGREDEWKITSKDTEYTETVDNEDIPVFLFPYNAGIFYTTKKSKRKDLYSHHMTITTTLEIKKKEEISIHFDNSLLSKYFEVDCSIKRVYDDLDPSIFKKTVINIILRAKKVNADPVKWWPLNSKGESGLILGTIRYDRFKTSFYMVQSPQVKGLRLYEFNPIGSNFSQVQKIEFSPIQKEKIYWMLTEEKVIPNYQEWWKVNEIKKGSTNYDLGIAVGSEEYLGKTSYKTQNGDEIIKRENHGKFSQFSKMAMRADVEVGTNTSSYYLKPDDEEIFTGNKYLTILDEFSIDNDGYITLGTSKIVSNNGIVQYDFNKNLNSKIGSAFVNLSSTPITKSVTTYINGVSKTSATTNKNLAESSKSANIKKAKSYTMTNARVPKAISTTASTDSRLVNTDQISLGAGASKYWVSDSSILGQFVKDTKDLKTTDVATTVGGAMLDNEYTTTRYYDSREKQDIVISFIAEDGTIRYTSKEEGISVKVVTDAEGKLIKDPRKIWDNKKLRPVIIKFEQSPKDINPLNGDPITFFRVSEEELSLDFSTESWRNMITRAQATYEITKTGQEPFIQIIEKVKNNDIKAWRFKNGRLEKYILRSNSLSVDTSYINRKPFIVRSNCPFKLTFKYNTGFESTLAFDKETEQMSQYTISNDSQTLYSTKYNSTYGQGIFMNVLEADDTGTIGKIVATYNDYSAESQVTASSFSNLDTATLVDKNGNYDKNAISKLILVNRGIAKNIFAYSRRTLHHMFTSFTDVEDTENLKTITTKDNTRDSLIFKTKTQHLRVSAANPYFNKNGYLNHKVTLDIERTLGRIPKFPLSPLGQLSMLPYNKSHSYNRNSSKGVQYYIYENGIAPKLTIKSQPGVLGGDAVDFDMPVDMYKSATISGTKYSLSPWGSEDINYRKVMGKYIPARWVSTNIGATTYYTLPGSEIVSNVPTYLESTSEGLDDQLFTCIENPDIWTKLDTSKITVTPATEKLIRGLKLGTKGVSVIFTLKDKNVSPYLNEHYIDSTGGTVTTASVLYKISHDGYNESWVASSDSTITKYTADIVLNRLTDMESLMADIGTTLYIKRVSSSQSHAYVRTRSSEKTFHRVVSGGISKMIATTGTAVLLIGSGRRANKVFVNYFKDKSENYYILDSRKEITKYDFIYRKSIYSLESLTFSSASGHDSKATFTVTSNYPLQYVKYDESATSVTSTNDYIEITDQTEIVDSVTYRRWDQYEWNSADETYQFSGKYFLFPTSGPTKTDDLYKPIYSILVDKDGYTNYDPDKTFSYALSEGGEIYRIYEAGAKVQEGTSYVVTDSPSKKYEIGTIIGSNHSSAINALNIPYTTEKEILSYPNRNTRGKMYSELLDIDIHVKPETASDNKPLFKIENITENALTSGEYEYTITLAPMKDFDSEGKRFCGQVIINSRIRNILGDSKYVPSDLIKAYPRVLPLYINGRQITNKTRPPKGTTWENSNKTLGKTLGTKKSKESSKFEYELSILPSLQKEIEKVVPSAELVVNIYQQKNNYVQLYGDRTRNVHSGEVRKFSTLYEPGGNYPYMKDDKEDPIKLGSETIRMKCNSTNWSGKESSVSFIAEITNVDNLIQYIPVTKNAIFEVAVEGSKSTTQNYYYLYQSDKKDWVKLTENNASSLLGTTITDFNSYCNEHKIGIIYTKNSSNNLKALGRLNNLKAGDIYKVTPHEYASEISEFYEYQPLDSTKEIQIQVNNYDPAAANQAGQPFASLYFNNIFSSYYPTKITADNIQSGKIISPYKSGSTRDNLVNFSIDLGKWNISNGTATVDELDYFVKGDETEVKDDYYVNLFCFNTPGNKVKVDEFNPQQHLYYVRWYKMEQSGNNYEKLDFYRLLLPLGIDRVSTTGACNGVQIDDLWVSLVYDKVNPVELYDVNGISLDYSLPQKYYFTEMVDNDTSVNYFTDMKGKMLVKYDAEKKRLYGTSANALKYWWKTQVSKLYQECVSFIQPGVNFGLVCTTSSNKPKLYLGESGKNILYEQVSGNTTYIDIMAGVFDLTKAGVNEDTVDLNDTFRRSGKEEMHSINMADRSEWFERKFDDAERTSEHTETINGIKYSVWEKYEDRGTPDNPEIHKYPDYCILINKKYDNTITVEDEQVKYISLLNIEDPDSQLKTLWPDYTLTIDGDTTKGYFDFNSRGEPLVDYKVIDGVERLYHSGVIEYDKWVKYENGKKYPGYYILMDTKTDYSSISLKRPKRADFTVRNDSDSSENYFNERGNIFVKYEYSHGDYIEKSEETIEIEGITYTKWYKYVYNENLDKFERFSQIYYAFKTSTGPVRKIVDGRSVYEADYTISFDSDEIYTSGSKLFDKEFYNSSNQIYKIYKLDAKVEEYLYKTNSDGLSATGTADLNISCADSITKSWSYEVLKDNCYVDFDGNYINNVRINFQNNTSENDVTRRFRIETKDDAGGIKHSAIIQITQSSFLGNVYTDEEDVYFMADGTYLGNYTGRIIDGVKEVDRYLYFDTDIPSSELEFTINDDPEASVILSMGDDTNSAYGTDFKRYRLSIKLGRNTSRSNNIRTLTITRYYSVYNDSTGTLVRKFKIIKTIRLTQGYQSLYVRSPYYVQKWLNKELDSDNPTPEFLSSGGIVGSFSDPLLVPYDQYIEVDSTTGMDYTLPLYYEVNEPSLENDKEFIFKKYTRTELLKLLGDNPITRQKWNIQSPKTIPGNIFEEVDNPVRFGVSVAQEQDGLKTPCLVYKYDTKPAYLSTSVLSYVEVTITLVNGNNYNFYVYMKKSNKN